MFFFSLLASLISAQAPVSAATSLISALAPVSAATSLISAQAPPSAPSPDWRAFTDAFDAHARDLQLVGGSALLLREGQVAARHHYGLADRASGARIDDSTIFHWASITKTLTAVAILQLRDRGKLSLDDPISTWLPELRRVHDPFGTRDSITIRQLLSHSSGFQAGTWPYGRGRPWEPFEPAQWEQLVAMMPYQQLHFAAGARYGYSNPGFIYLARVIEAITGDPWTVHIQKNIFAPLGLARSYVGATPYYLAAHRSHNYDVERDSSSRRDTVIDGGADFDPGITIPNSGWNAPLDDLATWLAFLTGAAGTPAEQARHDLVLSRASLDEMWRPVVNVSTDSAGRPRIDMGLSFFIHQIDGRRILGHTGSQAGFRSFTYFDPQTKSAIVWSFNTANARAGQPAGWARGGLVELAWRTLR
jgi:CubicO group peptidase (beta-lactamase class C family)